MDDLFDVKHGISIRGKEYGFVGITDLEVDSRVDEMLNFIESFKGSAGGTFGEDIEACVDFPYETLTIEKFTEFEKKFRKNYPTFDGHLYLHDINHFTADESKYLDSYTSFDDEDVVDNEGDEWKNCE
ncbi:MAG: hypothetical protein CBC02_005305 [Flavobacteriaceae bacterium TMED42]|nr:MAG: hypothetical protein CBC02_005305 [Flavobacteriaceae bacterium TMED42]